jgi:hypothetical protein
MWRMERTSRQKGSRLAWLHRPGSMEGILMRTVNLQATGIPASRIPVIFPADDGETKESTVYYDERNRLCGPPGAFLDSSVIGPNSWILCCPSCGEAGSPREGAKWRITAGSFDDVATLTLEPSIAKSCCGWHGYLERGFFVINRSDLEKTT